MEENNEKEKEEGQQEAMSKGFDFLIMRADNINHTVEYVIDGKIEEMDMKEDFLEKMRIYCPQGYEKIKKALHTHGKHFLYAVKSNTIQIRDEKFPGLEKSAVATAIQEDEFGKEEAQIDCYKAFGEIQEGIWR